MRIRLAWVSVLGLIGVALGGAQSAAAQGTPGQVVKLGEGETLTISGFVNASWYMNNGFFAFGNGQNAEWAAAAQPATDKNYAAADVRNTRINFTFAGSPVLGKWSPKGTIEADFFGAFSATPAPPFADEQPQLRIRLAYADLTNAPTTLRVAVIRRSTGVDHARCIPTGLWRRGHDRLALSGRVSLSRSQSWKADHDAARARSI